MLLPGKWIQLLFPLLLLNLVAFSQEISPYSRFGFGEIVRPVFTAAAATAGLGAAYRNPFHINTINPASYPSLRLTTIEGGLYFIHKRLHDGLTDKTYKTGDGFFDYFSLGFPLSKGKGGLSFGITPYSRMKYSFSQNRNDSIIGDYTKSYDGNGRIYRLYVGGAYNFFKRDTVPPANQFSIGANVAYIFGKLRRSEILDYGSSTFYNTRVSSVLDISNYALNVGAQYVRLIKKGETLGADLLDNPVVIVGAYASVPVVGSTSLQETWDRYVVLPTGIRVIDSVSYVPGDSKNIQIPVELGAGLSFSKKNFSFGVEGNYTLWDNTNVPSPDVEISNSWTMRAGGELSGKPNSSNLFKKTTYHLGGYYSNGNLTFGATRISEFGVSFGLGIPVIVFPNDEEFRFNITLESGSRGTMDNGYLKENFVRVSLGFTLSQRWFKKLRYD